MNTNTHLIIKVEKIVDEEKLKAFYPKFLKGLRQLWLQKKCQAN
jgi:hypothetical protein